MCTKEETINTGINIDTVNESNVNPHHIFNDSESIHENNLIYTGILLIATSKKLIILSTVVNTTDRDAIKCEPVTPTFLPKNPETIELNKGNIIIVKYII
jgi:hypothetical protein